MAALGKLLRTAEGGLLNFWCPGCNMAHTIRIAGPHAWGYNQNPDKPTFTPSVLTKYVKPTAEGARMMDAMEKLPPGMDRYHCTDEVCHSFVTDGHIQFLSDCTHKLAGQTVDLPTFPGNENAD